PSPEGRDALIGAGALEATPYIVPLGSLAQIPTTPHDGARVREFSSSAEWQVAAGAKFPLPDAMVRNQLVRKSALEWRLNIVPDGTLAALPTAPRDGARVQELASNAEWQIASGMKFALTDAGRREALIAAGALSAEVTVVPPEAESTCVRSPAGQRPIRSRHPGANRRRHSLASNDRRCPLRLAVHGRGTGYNGPGRSSWEEVTHARDAIRLRLSRSRPRREEGANPK